jgi:hypothetical protein
MTEQVSDIVLLSQSSQETHSENAQSQSHSEETQIGNQDLSNQQCQAESPEEKAKQQQLLN